MTEREENLLQFPCTFPIKAVGKSGEDFERLVFEIIQRHVPDLRAGALQRRDSRKQNWVAVTVTIEAQSRAQLDAIYRELSAHEQVIWAL